MSKTLTTTDDRMAMLPPDVPGDAVIVIRNLQREYDMGGERPRWPPCDRPGCDLPRR